MVSKKNLYYSIILFLLSSVLLAAGSLGWLGSITENTIGDIGLGNSGVSLSLGESVDVNKNGVPDVDGSSNIVYNRIETNDITIENCFPMYTTAYRVAISVPASGGYFNLVFKGISAPEAATPAIDPAMAFKIRYLDPQTSLEVDRSLYSMMDENRDASIIDNLAIPANGNRIFDFWIYMAGDAGNEYKNQTLGIDWMVLSVTQGS